MADIEVDPQTLVWGSQRAGETADLCGVRVDEPVGLSVGRGSPSIGVAAATAWAQWDRTWSQAHTDLDALSGALSNAATLWLEREEDMVAALRDLVAASGVGRG